MSSAACSRRNAFRYGLGRTEAIDEQVSIESPVRCDSTVETDVGDAGDMDDDNEADAEAEGRIIVAGLVARRWPMIGWSLAAGSRHRVSVRAFDDAIVILCVHTQK